MTHSFLPDFPLQQSSLEMMHHQTEQQQFSHPLESLERLVHPPIVRNLLTNELQDDSIQNNHSFITQNLTQTPLPSITSLQQKSNFV